MDPEDPPGDPTLLKCTPLLHTTLPLMFQVGCRVPLRYCGAEQPIHITGLAMSSYSGGDRWQLAQRERRR